MQNPEETGGKIITVIEEGQARIETAGNVFCNPVQEFNRDLSISGLNAFSRVYAKEKEKPGKIKDNIPIVLKKEEYRFEAGKKYENGLSILEALSATGLRSIRYAKEVEGINKIIANDVSSVAVENIKKNIDSNGVTDFVSASLNDATTLMYAHKNDRFDVIDLDPYGSPTIFLDSAVQAIKDGGLLLVTATDMAVLAGNTPETCYVKYGAVSLRTQSCHEMALRILLQTIESFANRYGRYIVPQLSISADFYIRVFVRVYTGAYKCKFTTSKLAMVHCCTGCDSFNLQPLGKIKTNEKNGLPKFSLPTTIPSVGSVCEHCQHPYHMGGPIWAAPIHNPEFVWQIYQHTSDKLRTYKRIEGMLNVVLEELHDTPLHYNLDRLTGVLHAETPPIMVVRSALLNAGYRVSYTHTKKTSIKTNAPAKVLWDIMRQWIKTHPVSQKWLDQDKVTANILAQVCETEYSFKMHPDAEPNSRRQGYTRFQQNPTAFWGPGCRATAMVGDQGLAKSKRNQGKRKRKVSTKSEESSTGNPGAD